MKRTYASEISPKLNNKKIELLGWIHEIRDLSNNKFIILRDVSGLTQLICKKDNLDVFNKIPKLNKESAVKISGIVKTMKQAPQGAEVVIENIEVLAESSPRLPIQTIEKGDLTTGLNKRLDNRFLDLRKPKIQAIFKIQSQIINSFRKFFFDQKFIEIQPPCIISSASEGGTELFPVKYFEQSAYLAQSPQLYKQMAIQSFEKVFMTVPVWRAEKHNTIRHLNECRQLDIEIAFTDEFAVMDYLAKSVQFIVKEVIENCKTELEILNLKIKFPDVKYITYEETINLLKKNKLKINYEDDISPEAEKKLEEIFPDTIIFIHDWPSSIKPFYIMPKTLQVKETLSRGFDAIYGGIEISSGGQRVHLPEILIKQIKDKKLNPDNFKYYIDSFRYACPIHSGWSIGLERFTMALLKLDNIREACIWPRDRDRLVP